MHQNFESLVNKGVYILNPDRVDTEQSPKQIVICGVARSGTSLVSGALHKLGVFMGKTANPPVYEDVELSRAFEMKHFDAARERISAYNQHHPVWGWKRPSSVDYLDTVAQVFPNPSFIFVFRDIFSIANRNRISMQADVVANMQTVYHQLGKLVGFIHSHNPVAMLVAYDKILLERRLFVRTLCDFIGLDVSEEQQENAFDFIRPNPSDYLDLSRNTKARGGIGKVEAYCVAGWARAVYHELPIKVELYVNEEKRAVTTADHFLAGLKEQGVHPTGRVGFRFDLTEAQKLNDGDVVRVRAENEVNDLNHSPKVFKR